MIPYYQAYTCPKCGGSLDRQENTLVCVQNHSYDIAQQGYVNLILANQKKSLQPGDTKGMIQSRDTFLRKGLYDFLMESIIETIEAKDKDFQYFLDVGCGSGFYLNRLANHFQPALAFGSDVSKEAMKYGAHNYKQCHFSVNNSFHLQFQDSFFDLIFSIFSPFDSLEIERILAKSGMFILVRPGEHHFAEIYDLLNIPRKEKMYPTFETLKLVDSRKVRKKVQLTHQDLLLLIGMTPLLWKMKNIDFDALQISELTLDFLMNMYEESNSFYSSNFNS